MERQLRNRDAAMRSRERKKMYVKDLEIKSRYMEAKCRRLRSDLCVNVVKIDSYLIFVNSDFYINAVNVVKIDIITLFLYTVTFIIFIYSDLCTNVVKIDIVTLFLYIVTFM